MSYPKAIKHESRIAFGIDFFSSESEADKAIECLRKQFTGTRAVKHVGYKRQTRHEGKDVWAVRVP